MKQNQLTQNQHGSMFPIGEITQRFLDHVKMHPGKVLDIGAAYGVTTVPALEQGAEVTAVDLSAEQLATLTANCPATKRPRLETLAGQFPDAFPVAERQRYYDTILASHVFHFYGPAAFAHAAQSIYQLLKPTGKLFVQCFTPYHTFMANMIPSFEQKQAAGDPWPGLTEASNDFALIPNLLPPLVNLMSPEILQREFQQQGFVIDHVGFTPCPPSLGKDTFVMDGREWVGLIAHKPGV